MMENLGVFLVPIHYGIKEFLLNSLMADSVKEELVVFFYETLGMEINTWNLPKELIESSGVNI